MIFYLATQLEDTKLEVKLDNQEYEEEELMTIKVPLNNPYQLTQSDFERVDGEINIDGKLFKYVKRRVVDGELILLCIPNHRKMQLEENKKDYFQDTNALALNKNATKSDGSKYGAGKSPLVEYDYRSPDAYAVAIGTIQTELNAAGPQSLLDVFLSYRGQPPRLA